MENRRSNIKVWEDTYKICETGFFSNLEIRPSIKYSWNDPILKNLHMESVTNTPRLYIINSDTFTLAEQMISAGYNPLVLNMANAVYPGGGYRKGAHAQEENLFRRSNYYKFLDGKEKTRLYPMSSDEMIYSPNVAVIKDKFYNILEKPFEVACIACAAINSPHLAGDQTDPFTMRFANSDDYNLTREKIRTIFKVAYLHGHDSLVLSALGCGVFMNPPIQIAEIFNEIMQEYQYMFDCFCYGVYSIRDQNYNIFNNILKLKEK